jgi:predicted MFS family arabinose efflux permease
MVRRLNEGLLVELAAAAAACALLPFFEAEDRPALFVGAGIAGLAGGVALVLLGSGGSGPERSAAAFLGATAARLGIAMAGLLVCFVAARERFSAVALSLAAAYLAVLGVETVLACRRNAPREADR